MTINTRQERAGLVKRPSKANAVALSAKVADFQLLLTNKFEALNSAPSDDIDTYCDSITSSITEAALKTAVNDKSQRPDKLSGLGHKSATGEATANEKKWNRCATHLIFRDLQSYQKSNVRGHQQLQ